MHKEGPISPALRELIAAYTSSLNDCRFCENAHAAVASQLYGDQEFVEAALRDPESSTLSAKDKALLRFVKRLTLQPSAIAEHDIAVLKHVGWDEPSIYFADNACALLNYHNRLALGNGVKLVSGEAFQRLGARMAKFGYSREQPSPAREGGSPRA